MCNIGRIQRIVQVVAEEDNAPPVKENRESEKENPNTKPSHSKRPVTENHDV